MHVKEGYFFTSPKRVTSPTWGPPPPCKQALIVMSTNLKYTEKIKWAAKLNEKKSDRELEQKIRSYLLEEQHENFSAAVRK